MVKAIRKSKVVLTAIAAALLFGGCVSPHTKTVVVNQAGGSSSVSVRSMKELDASRHYIGVAENGLPVYYQRDKGKTAFYIEDSSEANASFRGRVEKAKVVDGGQYILVQLRSGSNGKISVVDLPSMSKHSAGTFISKELVVEPDWVDQCASYILKKDGTYSVVSYEADQRSGSEVKLDSLVSPYIVSMVNDMDNVALLDAYFCSNGRYVVQYAKDNKTMLVVVDPSEGAKYPYIVMECADDKTDVSGSLVYYKTGGGKLMALDVGLNETWTVANDVEKFAVEEDVIVYTVKQGSGECVYAKKPEDTASAVIDIRKNIKEIHVTGDTLLIEYSNVDTYGNQSTGYALFTLSS